MRLRRGLLLTVVLLSGCAGLNPSTESTPQSDQLQDPTELAVEGVLIKSPELLLPRVPRFLEEDRELSTYPYTAVLYVTEAEDTAAIEETSLIVHFSHPPKDQSENFPETGDVVQLTGTYNPDHRTIVSDETSPQREDITVIGQTESPPTSPVVGEEGDRVQIHRHTFSQSASAVERIETEDVSLRIVSNDTAVVVNGTVRLGETLYPLFDRIVVEVTGTTPESASDIRLDRR